jgi:predicted DNA-binding transcriptional regulator AlpA
MNKNTSVERKMLSPAEVEAIFGIPRGSLANLRWDKRGPRYFKVGARKVMYRVEDVQDWVERNPVLTQVDAWERDSSSNEV